MTPIEIVRAKLEDAAEILALQKLAYQSEAAIHNNYEIPPLTQTLPEMEEDLRNKVVLVAVRDGRIIGSVRACQEGDTCSVGRLIVHPEFQNRGLGTRLMGEIEAAFAGTGRFELFTGHKSERNLYLYGKLGYKVFQHQQGAGMPELVYLEKCV
jgi:GNAT superfamily N-acetyltransferase